jgi:catalase
LHGRLFSYQDTQLSRLGTVNFHQIPVNRAKGCPFQNLQRDGQMQTMIFNGRANYEPNSLAEVGEVGGPRADPEGGFRSFKLPMEETKVRLRPESFADHYSQARLFYRSQSEIEQAHIASAPCQGLRGFHRKGKHAPMGAGAKGQNSGLRLAVRGNDRAHRLLGARGALSPVRGATLRCDRPRGL